MIQHFAITATLLTIAVLLAWACSIGLLVMRDPYQRLNFSSPLTISVLCILATVWVEESAWQAKIKMTIIAVVVALMNSVLVHTTARAIRIREQGQWPVKPEERIPTAGEDGAAIKGTSGEEPLA